MEKVYVEQIGTYPEEIIRCIKKYSYSLQKYIHQAARLQTFTDSFVFCGSKDKQYQQVGNAVPPIMANPLLKKLARVLHENLPKGELL